MRMSKSPFSELTQQVVHNRKKRNKLLQWREKDILFLYDNYGSGNHTFLSLFVSQRLKYIQMLRTTNFACSLTTMRSVLPLHHLNR